MNFQLILATRYLWGRKLRTFLTTLAIVIGVMVIMGTGIYLPTFIDAFQKNLLAISGQADVTITHKTGESFSTSVLNKVKAIDGIRVIAGSIERVMNIPPHFYGRDSTVLGLTLVGVDPAVASEVRSYPITQGRFLRTGDGNVAVITQRLADALGLKLGEALKVPTTEGVVKLTIVGLLPGRTLVGNEQVLMPLAQAQKWLDMSGRINVIEANLTTTDKAHTEVIINQIKDTLGKNYTLGGLTSGSEFAGAMQTGQIMFSMIGFLTLVMGGFIIFNTFRTIVAERRHDIGMLRAIGASRATIIGLILSEGLVQGVVGTAIGLGLGYLMGAGVTFGASTLLQQFMPNVQITTLIIEPSLVFVTILLGVGVTLFAGLLPAIAASRVTPIEALRPSAAETVARIGRLSTSIGAAMVVVAIVGLLSGSFALIALGGLLFLVGLVLVAPALVKPIANWFSVLIALFFAREGTSELAQGNLTRQPSRAAITASATMIGLAIVVGAGGMMFSLNDSLLVMFEKTLGSDYLLLPPSVAVWKGDVGASQTLANKIRSIEGVGAVSTLRYAQSYIQATTAKGASETTLSVIGIDPVEYPKVAAMDFQKGNQAEAFTALGSDERNVIVNGILAAQANLNVGELLSLSTPEGQQAYRIVAVGGDVLSAKINTAYISQAVMKVDFRKSEDILYQINLAPNGDAATVEQWLNKIVDDYPQFRLISGRAYMAEFGKQFDALFAGVYILLGVLAFPSLIAILNTLAIGVIERTREIGMVRAIGATRGQVWKTIVAEALLLAAIGTAFGILAGLYLSYVFVQGLSASGIYKMVYSFPFAGVLAATAVGLLFGVLAALIPARQAAQLEIIKALRYE
jgi:putative ABC transport system permease protein